MAIFCDVGPRRQRVTRQATAVPGHHPETDGPLAQSSRLHHNQAQSGVCHNGLQTGSPGRGARLPMHQLPRQGSRPTCPSVQGNH